MYYSNDYFKNLTDEELLNVIHVYNETNENKKFGVKKQILVANDNFTIKFTDGSISNLRNRRAIRYYMMTPEEEARTYYEEEGIKLEYNENGVYF